MVGWQGDWPIIPQMGCSILMQKWHCEHQRLVWQCEEQLCQLINLLYKYTSLAEEILATGASDSSSASAVDLR